VQQNFHNYDVEISSILTVYVHISDDLDIIVTKVFFFAHCTQLLLRYYVQPDDGYHKGRNM